MEKTRNRTGSWMARLTRSRSDLVIATVVLLGFFYYKGGLRLVAWLVIPFVLLLALSRLASRLLGKDSPERRESPSEDEVDRPDPGQLGGGE